jgi:hypothetical protein
MRWAELQIAAETAGAAILAADRHYDAVAGLAVEDSQDRQQTNPGFGEVKLYRLDRVATDAPAAARPGDVVFEKRLQNP